MELLGDPQRTYPVIHLTGTNGKTSTARMIDTLLRALGLRTGRFTSPHLESMTERISLDGEPMTTRRSSRAFNDVAPYTHLVDAEHDHPLSFFETIVGDGVRRFADAPVDVAVVEVGMGGPWDATNVVDAAVAVVHADRGRPREVPRRPPAMIARGEGRDHQARRHRDRCWPSRQPEVGRGARRAVRRGRRDAGPRGSGVRVVTAGCRRSAAR